MDQINVIPFIDIMLVLLAIVLTTATFISEGRLEIRLPESETQTSNVPTHPIEIAIDGDGALYIDDRALDIQALSHYLDDLDPSASITLRVDAATRFEHFIAVVDRLKARALERVTILTRRP